MKQAQRLVAYQPNGDRIGPLSTPTEYSYSSPLDDLSSMLLNYRDNIPGSNLLLNPIEVAVEYSLDGLDWKEIPNGRYLRITRSNDPVGRNRVRRFTLPSYGWQLKKIRQMKTTDLNADGKRGFLAATPGIIMGTLINEGHARGVVPGLTFDFTSTHDSNGQAWASNLTIYYEPGLDLLSILNNLGDQGLCDWWFEGRTLRMFNPDTVLGRHVDVKFFQGTDILAMPTQGSIEDIVHEALFMGDGGVTMELDNPTTPAPWGKWEGFVKQGGVSDEATMTILGGAYMEDGSQERVQFAADISVETSNYEVWEHYRPGDYVQSLNDEGEHEEYRIRQINFSRGGDGSKKITLVLNDRFIEREIRNARRTAGIVGGATSGGSGTPPTPPGTDRRLPSKVLGLVGSSSIVVTFGSYDGVVSLGWDPVDTAQNGTLLEIEVYEVWHRKGISGQWSLAATSEDATVGIEGYEPGETYQWEVRAIAQGARKGPFSDPLQLVIVGDNDAPETPSDPVLSSSLGTVKIEWDGLDLDGNPMAVDTQEIKVWRSDVPSARQIASLDPYSGVQVTYETEDLVAGESYSFALSAVDRAGNQSPRTSFIPVTVSGVLDDPDVQDQIIEAVDDAISGAGMITWSLNDPPLVGNETRFTGAIWWKRAGDGTIIGQWEWDGDSWEVRQMSHQVIASVDAGKITVGYLEGSIIRAGTIGVDRLVVGPATNRVIDSRFQNDSINAVRVNTRYLNQFVSVDKVNRRIAFAPGFDYVDPAENLVYLATTEFDPAGEPELSNFLQVEPGQRYRFSVHILNSSNQSTALLIGFARRGATGSNLGITGDDFEPILPAADTYYYFDYLVPSNVFYMLPVISTINDATAVGNVYVYDPQLYNQVNGVLIADGGITADKVAANAIVANNIAVGALDGKVITGATVRTAASGMRVEMSGSTLRIGDRPTSTTGTGWWFAGTTGFANVYGANSSGRALLTINPTTAVITMGAGSSYVQYDDAAQLLTVRGRLYTGNRTADDVVHEGTGWAFQANGDVNVLWGGQEFISFIPAPGVSPFRPKIKFTNVDFRVEGGLSNMHLGGNIYLTSNGSTSQVISTGNQGSTGVRTEMSRSGVLTQAQFAAYHNLGGNPFFLVNASTQLSTSYVRITSPMELENNIRFYEGGLVRGSITDSANNLRIASQYSLIMDCDDGGTGSYNVAVPGIRNRTIAGTNPTVLISSNGSMAIASSSRSTKINIENHEFDVDTYLDLDVKSWNWKKPVELYAEILDKQARGEEVEEHLFEAIDVQGGLERGHGMIAEEVEEAGVPEFVCYNDDGTPLSLRYDLLWLPLHPIVKGHHARLSQLEAELVAIKSQLSTKLKK